MIKHKPHMVECMPDWQMYSEEVMCDRQQQENHKLNKWPPLADTNLHYFYSKTTLKFKK